MCHSFIPFTMKTFFVVLACLSHSFSLFAEEKVWRILPVGDSITEGGATFANYRAPLLQKWREAKASVRYVGSRQSASPFGPLAHEGYGGKNSRFLLDTVPAQLTKHPADIVLLHACHNHFAEQKPTAGILADHEAMIAAFRKINPEIRIYVARPISSGKLPKYSYLPALGDALEKMAKRLHTEKQPVILVDQTTGFDPHADTIADLVHPNASGAEKMAQRWWEALKPLVAP
jgi:lysophospholipase L1-like esterase